MKPKPKPKPKCEENGTRIKMRIENVSHWGLTSFSLSDQHELILAKDLWQAQVVPYPSGR